MKTELYKYAVVPGIVKIGTPTTITLSALEPQHVFDDTVEYRVEIWDLVHQTGILSRARTFLILCPTTVVCA